LTNHVLNSYEFARALSRRVKHWRALTENSLSELGLSLGEFGALVSLSESGPQLMTNLANSQGITQAAVTGIIDKLEELGLAKREQSKTDKRKVRASITRKAKRKLAKESGCTRDSLRERRGEFRFAI